MLKCLLGCRFSGADTLERTFWTRWSRLSSRVVQKLSVIPYWQRLEVHLARFQCSFNRGKYLICRYPTGRFMSRVRSHLCKGSRTWESRVTWKIAANRLTRVPYLLCSLWVLLIFNSFTRVCPCNSSRKTSKRFHTFRIVETMRRLSTRIRVSARTTWFTTTREKSLAIAILAFVAMIHTCSPWVATLYKVLSNRTEICPPRKSLISGMCDQTTRQVSYRMSTKAS